MDYQEALANKTALEINVSLYDKALKAFPRGPMGLTPDSVKATPEWRAAKAGYDTAFSRLRMFNALFVKQYRKEIAASRKAYRQQLNKA